MKEFAELEARMDALAGEYGLYKASVHGWKNAYDEDEEYYGYAVWGLGGTGSFLEFQPAFTGPVTRAPRKDEEDLATNSDDFIGLMDGARLLILQALALSGTRSDLQFAGDAFQDQLFFATLSASLTMMTSAIERLVRIAGAVGKRPPSRSQRDFSVADALCNIAASGVGNRDFAARCLSRAEDVQWVVKERADWVHKIGSAEGRLTRSAYQRLREEAALQPSAEPEAASFPAHAQEALAHEAPQVVDFRRRLAAGYTAIIEFGNFVLYLAACERQRGERENTT